MPRRRRHRDRFDLNADVNVVSLIDVMLLLLVIFMITAPMMQGGVDIALPQAQAKPLESKDGVTITVNRAGQAVLDNVPYSLKSFRIAIKGLPADRTRNGVYLRADKGVVYETIAQILGILTANGITNVGLV